MKKMTLNLLVIRTKDIHILSQFYNKLGIEFTYHQHGKEPYHYSAELGELVFEIYPLLKNQTEADSSLRLGFTVKKLDELIERLKQDGVDIVQMPLKTAWGYTAMIKDLDGRKIELKE